MGRKLFALLLISLLAISISVPMSIWLLQTPQATPEPTATTPAYTRQDIIEYSQKLLPLLNRIYIESAQGRYILTVNTATYYSFLYVPKPGIVALGSVQDEILALGEPPGPMAEVVDLLFEGMDKSIVGRLVIRDYEDSLLHLWPESAGAPPTGWYYEADQLYDEAVEKWNEVLSQYNIGVHELTPYQDPMTLEQTKVMLQSEFTENLPEGLGPSRYALYQVAVAIVDDWYDKNKQGAGISLAFGLEGSELPLQIRPIRVSAEFSASPISGDAPLTVQFTDESTGKVTDWAWDFDGDGTVDSTEQNPSHTYIKPGKYTVSLSVDGPYSAATSTKGGYITVK